MKIHLKRTTTTDPDFLALIQQLDNELWNELNEDQALYDPHNKVPDIQTALVVYANDEPIASGCFKEYDTRSVEVKRMFVKKELRGKGISKQVLQALEAWAIDLGYNRAILETSIHFKTARKLYETSGYHEIDKYPPYNGLVESVCMGKELQSNASPIS